MKHLLLAYQEIGSNVLRHGRPPVQVRVVRTGRYWLLDVSDAAPDIPPVPAVGRDVAAAAWACTSSPACAPPTAGPSATGASTSSAASP